MKQTLVAYHGDLKMKQAVVAEMRGHAKADRLVQGYGYWKDGKGCAVGCLIKSGHHIEYESRYGIPVALAYIEDELFESLPAESARTWPARFLGAIQPGADLSSVPMLLAKRCAARSVKKWWPDKDQYGMKVADRKFVLDWLEDESALEPNVELESRAAGAAWAAEAARAAEAAEAAGAAEAEWQSKELLRILTAPKPQDRVIARRVRGEM